MPSLPSAPGYILQVDDDVDVLETSAALLELTLPTIVERPMKVVSVLDGASALNQLQQHRFDLVITDLNLRGIDGFMLIRHIRDGEAEVGPEATPRTVPIIVTSGYTPQSVEAARVRPLVDAFLTKPTERLVAEVVKILGTVRSDLSPR